MTTDRSTNYEARPLASAVAHSWDGGWYVFDQGQVKGPLSADEVFGRSSQTGYNPAVMVSRKGFSQWYPVKDFADMYHMATRYTDHLAAARAQPFSGLEPVARQIGPEATSRSFAQQAPTQSVIRRAQEDIASSCLVAPETANFGQNRSSSQIQAVSNAAGDQSSPGPISRKEKKRLIDYQRRQQRAAAKQAKAARKAARSQSMIAPVTFEQLYLETASRLRLGKIVSPVLASTVYLPLSFGGYWWAWFSRVSEEVSWHLNGSSRMNFILPIWMCMLPGAHLILAYLVARMVRQIEHQNGYQTMSPAFATVCALFPPFYIGMMQAALNRHWRLHVYHSSSNGAR